MKSAFKDIRSSLVSQDDRLRESHNHVPRSAMPLLQLFNTLTDLSTPEEVDKSLVLDHVTSALILLGSASQVVALTRQRAFDELLDKRFDSIKKNAPSADFLFGGSILKDIEDAEKASKLTSKVTRGQPSSSKSNHLYFSRRKVSLQ